MRSFGRHTALGRHPGVAEAVAALEVVEVESRDELGRTTNLLVDLDHTARAHDANVWAVPPDPLLDIGRFPLHDEDRMSCAASRLVGVAEGGGELAAEGFPRHLGVGRVERELARPARHGIPVDGDAGTVGPAVAPLREHQTEGLTETP